MELWMSYSIIYQKIVSPFLLFILINGRLIDTFIIDVYKNRDIYHAGNQYGIPGTCVNRYNYVDVEKDGKAVVKYIHIFKVPVLIQVNTYQFMVHYLSDP